ncbi:MAG: hypothetical protein RL619_700 [Bacteroidota bacterium]|jgi:hypothetical protein
MKGINLMLIYQKGIIWFLRDKNIQNNKTPIS